MTHQWLIDWLDDFIDKFNKTNSETVHLNVRFFVDHGAAELIQKKICEQFGSLAPHPRLAGTLLYLITTLKPVKNEPNIQLKPASRVNETAGVVIGVHLCREYLAGKRISQPKIKPVAVEKWVSSLHKKPHDKETCILIFDLLFGIYKDRVG